MRWWGFLVGVAILVAVLVLSFFGFSPEEPEPPGSAEYMSQVTHIKKEIASSFKRPSLSVGRDSSSNIEVVDPPSSLYSNEVFPSAVPSTVLEPPTSSPYQIQALPQSMIDEQNRSSDSPPIPVFAHD